ncbi:MAG TPA: hypothetical protein VLF89_06475 [Candidatus Saccharimonadales bacterium]|nr:hypothetical protein [Candidatus Saccharimonadales bacterium]
MKNQTYNKELEKYISGIKQDLLLSIITNLRQKKITLGEAKYLAKDFLASLPARDKGDILDKLYALTKTYAEARIVFAKYIGPFEEEKTEKKLTTIREYINKGDYENALQYAKGVN